MATGLTVERKFMFKQTLKPINYLLLGLCFWLLNFTAHSLAEPTILVGAINQSDALIALVVDGDNILAYACGGSNDWQSHTAWFSGRRAADGSFELVSQTGLILKGTSAGQAAKGNLTLASGHSFSWQSLEASAHSAAGLYRLETPAALTGFIVANDFRAVGSIRLIKPQAVAVLPVAAQGEVGVLARDGVDVCFVDEAQESCQVLPKVTGF
jgi:hypothetical protein